MKLTEAKLKQMILEAIKDRRFQDLDIPTPDAKLKSQLGDQTYDKIQSLDPEQKQVMKQTFDPDYPSKVKQEKINDIVEPLGFTEFKPGKFNKDDRVYKVFNLGEYGSNRYEIIFSYSVAPSATTTDFEDFKKHPKSIRYLIIIDQYKPSGFGIVDKIDLLKKEENIKTPKMFAVDMTDEQEREQIESLIVKKEKAAILKALEQLT